MRRVLYPGVRPPFRIERAWLPRSFVVLLAAVLAILAFSASASAHAVFESATPAPGTRLKISPPSVRIVFSEPLNAPLSGISIVRSNGSSVAPRSAGVDPANAQAYVVHLPQLKPDRYTVLWHTVSLVDGHTRRGSYSFTLLNPDGSPPVIGTAVIHSSTPLTTPAWLDAAAKWLGYAGLIVLAGVVLVLLVSSPASAPPAARQRLWRLLDACGLVGVSAIAVGSIEQWLATWMPSGGGWSTAEQVFSGRFGEAWLARMSAVAAYAAAAWLFRRRRSTAIAAVEGLLLAAAVVSYAAASHGAASSVPVWGEALDALHLASVSVWLGGVILLAAIFAVTRTGEEERPFLTRALRRVSLSAGAAVPVVIGSGVGSALIELSHPPDFWTTAYGSVLIAKLALVCALLAAAGANAFFLRRWFTSSRRWGRWLQRVVIAEALLGLCVLAPAAVLTISTPSRAIDDAQATARALAANGNPSNSFTAQTTFGKRDAEIAITPGIIGINQVHVEIAGAANMTSLRVNAVSPGGGAASATAARSGTERHPGGALYTDYDGELQLNGAPGVRQLSLAADGTTSPPVPLTVSAAAATGQPASVPPQSWLVVVVLAFGGAALIALARVTAPRATRVLASAAGTGGVAVAAALGIVFAVSGHPAPAAASWGSATYEKSATTSDASIWHIPTADSGIMIPAVAPDGSVWVGEMNTNKVARLLPDANTVQEFTFPGKLAGTMGAVVDAENHVWLAQEYTNSLGYFDPATGTYRQFPLPTTAAGVSGIALDGASNVWLTESGVNKIARFNPATKVFKEFPLPAGGQIPYWLAVGPNGLVWFSDFSGAVGSLDPKTGAARLYPTPAHERVAGIAVDGSGRIWFGTLKGDVYGMNATTGAMAHVASVHTSVYGVAVAADGTIWFGGTGGRDVYAVDPSTGRTSAYAMPAGSGPWWPATASTGAVWYALGTDSGNAFARINIRTP